MKLKFKHQKFQEDASNAICDIFEGNNKSGTLRYLKDNGFIEGNLDLENDAYKNGDINLEENTILANIQKIQNKQYLEVSRDLYITKNKNETSSYNFSVEMETGTGKTYTYIKTMYELNKRYGWVKFIVVVPSVAIREGVYKTFKITEDHFLEEYGKRIKYFIYDSANLSKIDDFASSVDISVMIINMQAFNSRGENGRRIYSKLDEFRSRAPIDVISATRPILIIDEPQSVEGNSTKQKLKEFNPLFTLRYSATLKENFNLVYSLDSVDAYNKKLVKKIGVKGITFLNQANTNGYIYFENIILSKDVPPVARLQINFFGSNGVRKVFKKVEEGDDLFFISNNLQEYKNNFIVKTIDARENKIEFLNGIELRIGQIIGNENSIKELRRIQIRETIISHIDKERELYKYGIKVLSLFFIDEVAKYRVYDNEESSNGEYAKMFEEEYNKIVESLQPRLGEKEYFDYLTKIDVKRTHEGYFSQDKKNKHFIDGVNSKEDVSGYDLIMKNKELLLSFSNDVRFIFSHSALKEGWDNPNVFQICTLKESDATIKKKQEIGRGLRLCVNQNGDRIDSSFVAENEVHKINKLTIIASESYESFSKQLQEEFKEDIRNRLTTIDSNLFLNRVFTNKNGNEEVIDQNKAICIYETLIRNDYIEKGKLTDKYYEDLRENKLVLDEELDDVKDVIIDVLDKVCKNGNIEVVNDNLRMTEIELNKINFEKKEFKELWNKINKKTFYIVDFDSEELVRNVVNVANGSINIQNPIVQIVNGVINNIGNQNSNVIINSQNFKLDNIENKNTYDLIGELVDKTSLTRKDIVDILKKLKPEVFNMFKIDPEGFINKLSKIINEQKATLIVDYIKYKKIEGEEGEYTNEIFTNHNLKGIMNENMIPTNKNVYDYLLYDSNVEKKFAEDLEVANNVVVYTKLPSGFYIKTPIGNYNPDWAIAFDKDKVKHIYFIAETKGSISSLDLRNIEYSKISCARKHFAVVSDDQIKFEIVKDYQELLNEILK